MWRRPVPPVAVALVLVLAVTGVAQTVHPAIIGSLERDPDGGWWRCLTALLVQSSGWFQTVFNFAALVVVAPVAARTLGNVWTLIVYLVAGVSAQVVSTAGWSPHGGGDSVAICGLVGALAVGYGLRGTRRELRVAALLIPVAAVVLCVLTNNHGAGLPSAAFSACSSLRHRRSPEHRTTRTQCHLSLDDEARLLEPGGITLRRPLVHVDPHRMAAVALGHQLRPLSRMEPDHQRTARPQRPPKAVQDGGNLGVRHVDQRIPGDDATESGPAEVGHRADFETHARVVTARDAHHLR
jgi:rhomboid protease GluP